MRSEITSTFGVVTQNALFAFRRDKGIIISQPSEQCRNLINRDYPFGITSEEVKNLQQCLRELGLFDFPVNTGFYGSVTQEAHQKAKLAIANSISGLSNLSSRCLQLINQNWSIGQTGSQVVELQNCLTRAGTFNYPFGSTGYFGPVTQEALQRVRQLLVSNTQSSNQTNNQNSPISNNNSSSDRCTELRNSQWTLGERSQRVRELQDCMTRAGFFNWPYGSTGYFGPVTQEALNRWRQATNNNPTNNSSSNTNLSCSELKKKGWVMYSRGDEVRRLQECMRADGVFTWPAGNTGFFGEATRASFLRWRQLGSTCAELKESGWIFQETGPHVVKLQECMRADGVFTWPAGNTGFFGDITRDALIRWRGYF